MHAAIYDAFKDLPDNDWVDMIYRSHAEPVISGVRLPGFPEDAFSVAMVGSAGEQCLREVAPIYLAVREHMRRLGRTFDSSTRVLEFGCGYGRLLRFFMKDVAPGNLVGTDVDPSFIALCRELFQGNGFHVNAPYPPLDWPDASFDVIYAYSVFSHLSEPAHKQWLKELRRLVRPNGLVLLTVRQKGFLYQCKTLREDPNASDYGRRIGNFFGDLNAMLPRYEKGEYIYDTAGGGGVRTNDFYGDTVIPLTYIQQNWTRDFRVMTCIDDLTRFAQALVALRPRGPGIDESGDPPLDTGPHPRRSLPRRILGRLRRMIE